MQLSAIFLLINAQNLFNFFNRITNEPSTIWKPASLFRLWSCLTSCSSPTRSTCWWVLILLHLMFTYYLGGNVTKKRKKGKTTTFTKAPQIKANGTYFRSPWSFPVTAQRIISFCRSTRARWWASTSGLCATPTTSWSTPSSPTACQSCRYDLTSGQQIIKIILNARYIDATQKFSFRTEF